MGHHITALVLPVPCDPRAAREWDVRDVPLDTGPHLVHIDHYYTAYWQARRGTHGRLPVPAGYPTVFPSEAVIGDLAAALTGSDAPTYAIITTDYFGGAGAQWAVATVDGHPVPEVRTINDALRALGVRRGEDLDEFDTVGLSTHRSPPEYLERYGELCDELGV